MKLLEFIPRKGIAAALKFPAGLPIVVPLLIAVVGAVASLVVRFRRARGQERQQLKWFLYGGVLFVVPFLMHGSGIPQQIQNWALALFIPALPISIAIAMLKYRLYDIDLVISRTLVYGALATFISAVYLVAVVGVGALVGLGNRVNLMLSLLMPVVILAIPIFDTTLVSVARTLHGRSISQGGRDHSSHRLFALGLSERATMLVMSASSTKPSTDALTPAGGRSPSA